MRVTASILHYAYVISMTEEETAKDIFAALVELVRREVTPSVGGSRGTIAKTHERHRKNDQVARLANQQKT